MVDLSQFSLEGKVALITGANRGIGKLTAIGFAKAGADVAIASRNTPDRGLPTLEEVADEIGGLGRKALPLAAHMGRLDQINDVIEKVTNEFGRIDILVNNAGTSNLTPVLEVEEKLWDSIMNVNLKGLFFTSQAAARVMKEHGGGKIINVASVDGLTPEFEVGVYSISKAGVIMATRVMAWELAKHNIRVNCIAPGAIRTRLLESKWTVDPESKERIEDRVPLSRVGRPEEIADAMIYLASDASSYVTGETIVVDGGYMVSGSVL